MREHPSLISGEFSTRVLNKRFKTKILHVTFSKKNKNLRELASLSRTLKNVIFRSRAVCTYKIMYKIMYAFYQILQLTSGAVSGAPTRGGGSWTRDASGERADTLAGGWTAVVTTIAGGGFPVPLFGLLLGQNPLEGPLHLHLSMKSLSEK